MAVRRSLQWVLGGSAALSALALLTLPSAPPAVMEASPRDGAATPSWGATSGAPRVAAAPVALPERIEREPLAAAEQDPFMVPAVPAAAPVPTNAPAPVPPPVAPAPPPPPQPPAMTHRYFGSMRTPDGQALVYLSDGTAAVAALPGAALSSGYVVDSVSEREVRLLYPPLAHAASVTIPLAPNTP